MTTQQPEALDLANWLDAVGNGGISSTAAAAELRRQHARIAELEAALEAIGAGGVSGPLMGCASIAASAGSEPVATVFTMEALAPGGGVKYHATVHKPLPAGTKLYTNPSPPEGMVGGWQDIATAQKDGTWIELWRTPTDFGRMSPFVIARWDGTESMFVWTEFCDPFTKYGRDKADAHIAQGDCYGSDDFTHWRALSAPPPPASEASGVDG